MLKRIETLESLFKNMEASFQNQDFHQAKKSARQFIKPYGKIKFKKSRILYIASKN